MKITYKTKERKHKVKKCVKRQRKNTKEKRLHTENTDKNKLKIFNIINTVRERIAEDNSNLKYRNNKIQI